MRKLVLDHVGAKVLLKTAYNPYLKENFKLLGVLDFIAEFTQHVPARGLRTIRYYGLYSSRSRAKWPQWQHVVAHAPEGWRQGAGLPSEAQTASTDAGTSVPASRASSTWARLIKLVYEVDPLICPKCGSEMTVIAIIHEPAEIRRILDHLLKTGRAPPGVTANSLN